MTTVNSNNGNGTKSDIFSWDIQIWYHFPLVAKCQNISMTFIIDIFQLYCKSDHKQVKWNEMKQDMSKSNSIFSYLNRGSII